MQIAIVLGLLILSLVLYSLEIVSVDIVALGALIILIVAGILTPDQAFTSFGSEMIVLLASIFVIAGALMRTGTLDTVGFVLYRRCGGSYKFLLGGIVLIVSAISAFMNNTVVTAVFVPVVLAVARRAKLPPSKLLMPVAFAAMLGGTCTLIGTSTNIAASSFMVRRGMEPFRLFEFLPVGVTLVIGGVLFFVLFGDKVLPVRGSGDLAGEYRVKEYLTEVSLRADCPFVGQRVDQTGFQEIADVSILGIIRGGSARLAPEGWEIFQDGDILLLKGEVEGIQKLRSTPGIESRGEVLPGDRSLESESVKLVEVMVGPASRFVGRSLKEVDFRRRYGLTVLALHRQGEELFQQLGKIPLKIGDVLLVQGPEARLSDLRTVGNVLIFSDLSHFLTQGKKGFYVVAFFAIALLAGALGLFPLSASILAAAVLSVLVRAVPAEEVYRLVNWRLLLLIGGMTSFGQAMVNTGTDRFLANLIVRATGPLGAYGILAGFFVLTVALTQPLSNAAAALAVLPIALATAESLGVSPRTFAVVVTLAASASFITPLEPSCVLVYPAGRYRFSDFVKAGGALTIVTMIIILAMVPLIWPLYK